MYTNEIQNCNLLAIAITMIALVENDFFCLFVIIVDKFGSYAMSLCSYL